LFDFILALAIARRGEEALLHAITAAIVGLGCVGLFGGDAEATDDKANSQSDVSDDDARESHGGSNFDKNNNSVCGKRGSSARLCELSAAFSALGAVRGTGFETVNLTGAGLTRAGKVR
jgi:hypothetical protein